MLERDDAARFDVIYETHVDFVWRSARRLGVDPDALEDVVQNVFVTVVRQLATFEGRSSLRTWLYAIVVRVVRDYRRWKRRKKPGWIVSTEDEPVLTERAMAASDPHAKLEASEGLRLVEEALSSLDELRREVFVLAELEQFTPAEIARILEIPAARVYVVLRAARADFNHAAERLQAGETR